MDRDIEDKLRKLLKLAERGVGGEKTNAQRMLERLLIKHGIAVSDITDKATEMYWFRYRNQLENRLLTQIIYSVLGRDYKTWQNRTRRQAVGARLTKQKMLEVELKFGNYRRALKEETEIFFAAFIHKQQIFPDDVKDEDPKPMDREKTIRIEAMMMSMKRVAVRKALPMEGK